MAELLAAARHLAAVVERDAGGDRAGRRAVLTGLGPVEGVLAAVRSAVLLAERDSSTWQRPGVPSFEAAHGSLSRGGLPGARREIRQADVIATMPVVADAVRAGTMPVGHLDAFARVAATASETVGAALATPAVQDAVVRMATAQDNPTFTRSLQRMVAELDPAARDLSHQNQRARRFLHLSDQADGTHVRGLLDRVAGHRLRLALEATGERPTTTRQAAGPGSADAMPGTGGTATVIEERTSEQARADALDVIARRILSLPETASGAAVPPQISLLMTDATFSALRTAAAEGRPPAAVDGAPVPAVTLEDGTPVPTSEVVKTLCDCDITRIVVDAADQPVNLGRTARLYTGAHRRAIIARDRQCAFTGCDRHARWSEIHHIRWWDRDNGETSLENGVLLCSFHHHQVHQYNLTIQRHPAPRGRGLDPPGTRYTFRDPAGRLIASDAGPPGCPDVLVPGGEGGPGG